jgi:hypothetical protein
MNKRQNKGNKGIGKNCIHDEYNSPPTKAPMDNIILVFHYVRTSLDHTTLCYMAWMTSFGNIPLLMDAGPIGHFVFFFSFV